tara:strand:- start:118 stop:3588 length:3471 start_codon:yes stop_codon:yes gene_type:complete
VKKKTNRKAKRVSEFKFESSSTPGKFYTVTVEGESYDCTCPGFMYRKKCSHLEKAKNQKQVEPVNEEELVKDTSPEKLRKNLFPDIEFDWDRYNRPFTEDIIMGQGGGVDYIFYLADKIADESCRAAFQLGRIRDKGAVKSLIGLLNGEITSSLSRILENEEIADPSIHGFRFRSWLNSDDDYLEDTDLNEMVEKSIVSAANALGEIGDERAIEPLIKALEKALESDVDFEDDPTSCGNVVSTIADVLTDTYSLDLVKVPWTTNLAKEFARGWIDDYCYTCQKFVEVDMDGKCPICDEDDTVRAKTQGPVHFHNVESIIYQAQTGYKVDISTFLKSLQILPLGTHSKIGLSLDEIQAMHDEPIPDNGLQKCKYCENSKVNADWKSSTFCDVCFEKREAGQMRRVDLALSDWGDNKLSKELNELIPKVESGEIPIPSSPLEFFTYMIDNEDPVSNFFREYLNKNIQKPKGSPAEQKAKKARLEAEEAAVLADAKKFRIGVEEGAKITVELKAKSKIGREAKREAKKVEREAKKVEEAARKVEKEKINLATGVSAEELLTNEWVSATKTRNYMNQDPILDWFDLYGDKRGYQRDTAAPKYDANLDFVQLLFRKGNEFETKVINYLKKEFGEENFVTVAKSHKDSRDSAKQEETLQHMKNGIAFILQGVLRNSENKTYGMPDIMVRSDFLPLIPDNQEHKDFQFLDRSAKELGKDYHYRIIDVKFTTLTYNADGQYLLGANAHKSQLAIYNMALGKLQGYMPPEAYLIGRNWKRTKAGAEFSGEGAFDKLGIVDLFNIDREYETKAEEAVDWIRKVRKEGSEWTQLDLRSHNIWPNCNNTYDYPWHNTKMWIANEFDELTRVWQIGPKEREQAHNQRIYSWRDSKLTPEKMGIRGSVKSEIMREVLRINNQKEHKVLPLKISNNDRNWQQKQKLEFFVDFETVSNIDDDFADFPKQGGQELIFMIGCGYELDGKFKMKVFTAKKLSVEEEARIMTEWFGYMEQVKTEIDPDGPFPKIFHWSPAELTFMGVAQNNFEGDEKKALEKIYKGQRRKMIKNWKDLPWFDFLKVMKDEPIVVKDAFGFGLKAIATNLEKHGLTTTTWEDGPADGLGAMVGAWHCDKIEGIDMDQTELMQGIKEYNIIDCKAMWDLINYLRANHT